MVGTTNTPTDIRTAANVTKASSLPPWLETSFQQAVDRASAASREQMPIYQGQRVAGFTPETMQAQELAKSQVGQYAPLQDAGVAATQAATQPFNADMFSKFNDPYKTQVTDEIARLGNRNFTENLMPQLNSQFTGSGMFGSSRNAEVLGQAARDTQAGITGKQGEYLSSGFQNSMKNYQDAMDRQMRGGVQMGNQALQGQNMGAADVKNLSTVGAEKQNLQQRGLETAYNEFIQQRDQPREDIKFFSDILRGTPSAQMGTEQASGSTPTNSFNNAVNQAGQVGTVLTGLSSAFPQTFAKMGFADGGSVKAKRTRKKGNK